MGHGTLMAWLSFEAGLDLPHSILYTVQRPLGAPQSQQPGSSQGLTCSPDPAWHRPAARLFSRSPIRLHPHGDPMPRPCHANACLPACHPMCGPAMPSHATPCPLLPLVPPPTVIPRSRQVRCGAVVHGRTHVSSDRGAGPAAGCRGSMKLQPGQAKTGQAHPAEHAAAAAAAHGGRPCRARARRWMRREAWSRFAPFVWRLALDPPPSPSGKLRASLASRPSGSGAGRAAVLAFCLKDWLTRGTLYIDALRRSDALAGPTSKALGERTVTGLFGSTIWATDRATDWATHQSVTLSRGVCPSVPFPVPVHTVQEEEGRNERVCGKPAAPSKNTSTTTSSSSTGDQHPATREEEGTTATTTTTPEGARGVGCSGVVRRATATTPTTPMRYDLTIRSQRTRWLFPGQHDGLSKRRRRVGVDEGVQGRRGSSSKGQGGSLRSSIRSSSSHGRGDGRDDDDNNDNDIDNDNNITNNSHGTQSHHSDCQRLPAGDSWQQPEP